MKKLFLLITLLLTIPATHTAAPLKVPPYTDIKRAETIRKKFAKQYSYILDNRHFYRSNSHETSVFNTLKAADALESTSMSNLEKLNVIYYSIHWPERQKIITYMIEKENKSPNDIIYQTQKTPLYESIEHSNFTFSRYLLEQGADVNRPINNTNRTLLNMVVNRLNRSFSAHTNNSKLLKLLISFGINPDEPDSSGETARSEAHPKVKLLIERAEKEKQIKEFMPIMTHIPSDLTYVVMGYLNSHVYACIQNKPLSKKRNIPTNVPEHVALMYTRKQTSHSNKNNTPSTNKRQKTKR